MPTFSDDTFMEKQGMRDLMRSTASAPASSTADTVSAATQAQTEQAGLVSHHSPAPRKPFDISVHCRSQNRAHFKRFMESMVRSCGKMKSLKKELENKCDQQSAATPIPQINMSKDVGASFTIVQWTMAPSLRSIKDISEHIKTLEKHYNILTDEYGQGAASGYGTEREPQHGFDPSYCEVVEGRP